jgi:hypothetical protein
VCPHCEHLNAIRRSAVKALPVFVLLAGFGEVRAWESDMMYAHVFALLPVGVLRAEVPVFALLSAVGATVWGAVKLAKIIKGRQPRLPNWGEEDYQDSDVTSYTITPPFRNEPARISLYILKTGAANRGSPGDKDKP